jgi:uncharacterized CHY-type Zn-finger protein
MKFFPVILYSLCMSYVVIALERHSENFSVFRNAYFDIFYIFSIICFVAIFDSDAGKLYSRHEPLENVHEHMQLAQDEKLESEEEVDIELGESQSNSVALAKTNFKTDEKLHVSSTERSEKDKDGDENEVDEGRKSEDIESNNYENSNDEGLWKEHASSDGGSSNDDIENGLVRGGTEDVDYDLVICSDCEDLIQPLRAAHCRHCKSCIATFDHHCHVLGTCIGERNAARFLLLVLSHLALMATTLHLLINHHGWYATSGRVVEVVIVFINLLSLTVLFVFHCYLCVNNLTTHEVLRGHRLGYMLDDGGDAEGFGFSSMTSPFNQGVFHNIFEYFQRDAVLGDLTGIFKRLFLGLMLGSRARRTISKPTWRPKRWWIPNRS